jgi:hypothetical protein
MTADLFATMVRKYCLALGGSVTSWGRTPAHNIAVGGDPRSLHQVWKAADVTYDALLDGDQLVRVRREYGATWNPAALPPVPERQAIAGQLSLYLHPEGDHDHLRPLDEAWVS